MAADGTCNVVKRVRVLCLDYLSYYSADEWHMPHACIYVEVGINTMQKLIIVNVERDILAAGKLNIFLYPKKLTKIIVILL